MAIDRRQLLVSAGGSLLAATAPRVHAASTPDALGTWTTDGVHFLAGNTTGDFVLPLPGRGHEVSLSPDRGTAIVFARRPGRFLVFIDLREQLATKTIWCPTDRHLYGHGAFSPDGSLLYVPENAFESGEGRLAVLDVRDGYRRVGDLPSHGVGPHDLVGAPDSEGFVIANGGIRTHPDSDREKLNIATMEPSLVMIDGNGRELDRTALPDHLHQVSLRHLDITQDGLVAAGGQWEGPAGLPVPLVVLWRPGGAMRVHDAMAPQTLALQGYIGQIAFDRTGRYVAATSPVGAQVVCWDTASFEPVSSLALADVCGISATEADGTFLVTSGLGTVGVLDAATGGLDVLAAPAGPVRVWDNHLTGA